MATFVTLSNGNAVAEVMARTGFGTPAPVGRAIRDPRRTRQPSKRRQRPYPGPAHAAPPQAPARVAPTGAEPPTRSVPARCGHSRCRPAPRPRRRGENEPPRLLLLTSGRAVRALRATYVRRPRARTAPRWRTTHPQPPQRRSLPAWRAVTAAALRPECRASPGHEHTPAGRACAAALARRTDETIANGRNHRSSYSPKTYSTSSKASAANT
jgi:hypothetical protein